MNLFMPRFFETTEMWENKKNLRDFPECCEVFLENFKNLKKVFGRVF